MLALLLGGLIGCRLPGGTTLLGGAGLSTPAAHEVPREVPPLVGRALFAKRAAQATMDEVAIAATVSLINTGTNVTVATGLTDQNGRFSLKPPRNFVPDGTATYYLEAYKGLDGNRPGADVARVRTVTKIVNGAWLTLTNAAPDGDIVVGPASTAIALGAALRKGTALPVDFDALIGKLSGNTFTPVPNLSNVDFNALFTLVQEGLSENRDPVQTIGYDVGSGTWKRVDVPPSQFAVDTLSPSSGVVGSTVTISGRGFSTNAAAHIVRFNGVPAVPDAATETSLSVRVPPGATSGPLTAQIHGIIAMGPIFTVPVVVSGFAPASAAPGTTVTLTGSGFDMATLSNNAVRFTGNVLGVVTAASETTLKVTVPSGAVSGPLNVSVSGTSTITGSPLAVLVSVTGLNPFVVQPNGTFTVSGTGFGSTVASVSVSVGGSAFSVLAASPTALTVRAPGAEMVGPLSVQVEGQTGVSPMNLRVFVGLAGNALIQKVAGARQPAAGTLATNWGVSAPRAITFDAAHNAYFVAGDKVYKVDTAQRISVVAGSDESGFSGDGGPATSAKLYYPTALATDAAGNLYIADSANYRVRKVAPNGIITTYAGNGSYGFSGDGGAAASAQFKSISALAFDAAGNLYIADPSNYRIRRITPGGIVSTVAGNGTEGLSGDGGQATSAQIDNPGGLACDAAGNLYYSDIDRDRVRKIGLDGVISAVAGNGGYGFAGDGGPATSAWLKSPRGLAFDGGGNLYIGDYYNSRVRKVASGGTISTVAGSGTSGNSGDGGPATAANLAYPNGVAIDHNGDLYIADNTNGIRKVDAGGTITTAYGTGFHSYSGDGEQAITAQFYSPSYLALDPAGNLYVADTGNQRIRKIAASGVVTTVAGNGTGGYAGDAGPATAARLSSPTGVAVDATGNLYIADTDNYRVRKVTPGGTITTVVGNGTNGYDGDGGPATSARIGTVYGLAVDASGNLYLADYNYHVIRKVTPGGVISTVAGTGTGAYGGDGGLAVNAQLKYPYGLAVDTAGNLYIADNGNHSVRKVTPAGLISTVAGSGINGYMGDGGPAASARLFGPKAVSVDVAGNLYVTDIGNACIRKVTPEGMISTIAGNGTSAYTGDGGQAKGAQLAGLSGVTVNSAGTRLYLSDIAYNCLRKIE